MGGAFMPEANVSRRRLRHAWDGMSGFALAKVIHRGYRAPSGGPHCGAFGLN